MEDVTVRHVTYFIIIYSFQLSFFFDMDSLHNKTLWNLIKEFAQSGAVLSYFKMERSAYLVMA
jgi:hypothetical protein